MNKDRLARIAEIVSEIEILSAKINDIASEEQEAFDAMPEGLQNADAGNRSSEATSNLEQAASYLDDAVSSLNDIY